MSTPVDTTKAGTASTAAGEIPVAPKPKSYSMIGPYVGIVLIILYCLAPFYWMIVSSLRRPADQFQTTLIPQPISFQNYIDVFNPSNNFARALLNSIIVASSVTVLTLIIGTFAAYALARLDFPFKNVSLGIIIACSMFPGIAMVIPSEMFLNGKSSRASA